MGANYVTSEAGEGDPDSLGSSRSRQPGLFPPPVERFDLYARANKKHFRWDVDGYFLMKYTVVGSLKAE